VAIFCWAICRSLGGCINASIGEGTMDASDERNKLFEDWVKQQLHISDEQAHTALYGDAEGNPLFKKLSSRPFSRQDDQSSLERLRRWETAKLEYFLEERRKELFAIKEKFPNIDPLSHPQIGRIKFLERFIRLVGQVLDEREAAGRDVHMVGSQAPHSPVAGQDDAAKPGRDDAAKPGQDDAAKPGQDDAAKPGQDDAAKPKTRGRRSKFTEDRLRQARAAKDSGKTNDQVAKILYSTNTTTPGQRRSVSTILRHHDRKLAPPSKK
jgi:hypothetical protein